MREEIWSDCLVLSISSVFAYSTDVSTRRMSSVTAERSRQYCFFLCDVTLHMLHVSYSSNSRLSVLHIRSGGALPVWGLPNAHDRSGSLHKPGLLWSASDVSIHNADLAKLYPVMWCVMRRSWGDIYNLYIFQWSPFILTLALFSSTGCVKPLHGLPVFCRAVLSFLWGMLFFLTDWNNIILNPGV